MRYICRGASLRTTPTVMLQLRHCKLNRRTNRYRTIFRCLSCEKAENCDEVYAYG
jgi:hypothetical protein